ncbi:MAG: HD-GYP domain-containing protein [Luteibacter sp.]|uniref:HD-GYP domain-containing protein n=1 Tax=unclassified Luteibacter TaxID=2620188 RepID=UPI0005B9A16B|nr:MULTISPECIES: HD-GYP domain-containing protein [unclassified Luteibacter]MDQ7997291.1 HD-GYP domain-containing protein [Luteibacter sp.]MDQ8049366.1 HD-GYP domain-containing protein [Luteibacter sp.]MDR6641002.1 putative nucleotidyltransferase with HDIG domain [Luteibacter sp. 1214]
MTIVERGSPLKEIPMGDLRLGMFVHKVGVSWVSHPFWRTKFLLEAPDDLATLRALDVPTIWIDTDRGMDVPPADVPVAAGGSGGEAENDVTPGEHPAASPAAVSVPDPVATAAALCERARGVVVRMFQDARLGRGIDAVAARELVDDMSRSIEAHPSALLSLVRLKTADDYTYMHSVAVAALMLSFARHLGLDALRVRAAGMAGMLHDVGKSQVPLEVLNKPMELSVTETNQVRKHPQMGHRLLVSRGGVDNEAVDACLHHHEKFDGTGYPHGLVGEQITRLARMTAICDVYDAITSDRPYKKGWDPAHAVQRMASWRGHFDPRLFRAFVRTVGVYPTGALVRLESGRLAVVLDGSRDSLTQPLVRVFYSIVEGRRVDPFVLDLATPGCEDRVAAKEARGEWSEAELAKLALP